MGPSKTSSRTIEAVEACLSARSNQIRVRPPLQQRVGHVGRNPWYSRTPRSVIPADLRCPDLFEEKVDLATQGFGLVGKLPRGLAYSFSGAASRGRCLGDPL